VECGHIDTIRDVTPSAPGCEECLETGSWWVHLRLCMSCGHVGCCESSPNKHASRHADARGHPVVQSLEPGEDWLWCYVDKVYLEPASAQ
jgi:uncharacterized UBP type Zn finger protein